MCTLFIISDQFLAVAPINSVVYPVAGGMEDWLYAAGWDRSEVSSCDGVAVDGARTTHLRRTEDPRASKEGAAASRKIHSTSSLLTQKQSRNAYAGRSNGPHKKHLIGIDDPWSGDRAGNRALAGRRNSSASTASENRAVVFLVETSDHKAPVASSMGRSSEVTPPSTYRSIDPTATG